MIHTKFPDMTYALGYAPWEAEIIIRELQNCKPYLWDGESTKLKNVLNSFVCHAISDGLNLKYITQTSYSIDLINHLVKGFTFEDWVLDELHLKLTNEELQSYRLQWVDYIIEYLQTNVINKGN